MVKSAILKQEGSRWILYSHSGNILGRHDSKESALKQERAIQMNKHSSINSPMDARIAGSVVEKLAKIVTENGNSHYENILDQLEHLNLNQEMRNAMHDGPTIGLPKVANMSSKIAGILQSGLEGAGLAAALGIVPSLLHSYSEDQDPLKGLASMGKWALPIGAAAGIATAPMFSLKSLLAKAIKQMPDMASRFGESAGNAVRGLVPEGAQAAIGNAATYGKEIGEGVYGAGKETLDNIIGVGNMLRQEYSPVVNKTVRDMIGTVGDYTGRI